MTKLIINSLKFTAVFLLCASHAYAQKDFSLAHSVQQVGDTVLEYFQDPQASHEELTDCLSSRDEIYLDLDSFHKQKKGDPDAYVNLDDVSNFFYTHNGGTYVDKDSGSMPSFLTFVGSSQNPYDSISLDTYLTFERDQKKFQLIKPYSWDDPDVYIVPSVTAEEADVLYEWFLPESIDCRYRQERPYCPSVRFSSCSYRQEDWLGNDCHPAFPLNVAYKIGSFTKNVKFEYDKSLVMDAKYAGAPNKMDYLIISAFEGNTVRNYMAWMLKNKKIGIMVDNQAFGDNRIVIGDIVTTGEGPFDLQLNHACIFRMYSKIEGIKPFPLHN